MTTSSDWLPLDEGWVSTSLAPPLHAAEAWDLARITNVYVIRLQLSRHEIDRVGSAAVIRAVGDYCALAKALDHEARA